MTFKLDIKKFLFLILCCLNFYSVIFEDFKIIGYIFYYVVPFCFLLLNYKIIIDILKRIINNGLYKYIICCVLLGILSIIIPIIYGTQDFSYFSIRIMQIVKETIKMIFLLVYFIKYISKDYDYKSFMKYFIISTCIYVSFTMLTIIFPAIREFIINHLETSEITNRLFNQENYFTRFGWAGFSGFTFTLKASLSVAFSLYLILIEQKQNFFRNCLFLLVSFLGNFFYGRIGLVVSGILILISLFYLYKKNKSLAKKVIIYLTVLFIVMVLFALCNKRVQMWFEWAFQSILNFIATGSFSTSSTDVLKNMYILPSFKTFCFGDGYYSIGDLYYMNIDVGLLRPIYFGGIIFQILRYYTIYILFNKIYNSKILYKNYLIICLTILFVIFELKGESIFPIVSILFVITILLNTNEETND